FLQGSYRRHTAVRPRGDSRPDVDIIIVTSLESDPVSTMGHFKPFLRKHYADKWRSQGRSFGITMSNVDLDVVVTKSPPAAEHSFIQRWAERFIFSGDESGPDWKQSPLLIPDRLAGTWDRTDPLAQIAWTNGKNSRTNGNFVNVV